MRKPLQVGDLVWYNVGGRGYETMGLVIETADLWQEKKGWAVSPMAKKYANCVRIQWMRVGKLKPRTIHLPLYRKMMKYHYEEVNAGLNWEESHSTPWKRHEVLPQLGEIESGEWYESHFFKSLGNTEKRRK